METKLLNKKIELSFYSTLFYFSAAGIFFFGIILNNSKLFNPMGLLLFLIAECIELYLKDVSLKTYNKTVIITGILLLCSIARYLN